VPARGKGPRLWLRRERVDRHGSVRAAVWLIRDGRHCESTGCARHSLADAEQALGSYLAHKHAKAAAQSRQRHPAAIPLADVLNLYLRDVVPQHARPDESRRRIAALAAAEAFRHQTLAAVTGESCRAYAKGKSRGGARRDLEELRAAINHHRSEGLCSEIVSVVLPQRGLPRERWLTRTEAAKLLRAAWRYREQQNGRPTERRSRRHVARFILVALYTGTRAGAVCTASFTPQRGAGHVDLDRGVFYRRAEGARPTKKRQPPVPLPEHLIAHLRRWQRRGQRFAVEWNGAPVASVKKAFAAVVKAAGLGREVTPHVLRHTAATWLMQAGVDPWEASGYLGMTVQMLIERYGHHHPDHLGNAKRGFGAHRRAGKTAQAVAEAVAGKSGRSAK
jgi:integrase